MVEKIVQGTNPYGPARVISTPALPLRLIAAAAVMGSKSSSSSLVRPSSKQVRPSLPSVLMTAAPIFMAGTSFLPSLLPTAAPIFVIFLEVNYQYA
jgi:hypothetical protein